MFDRDELLARTDLAALADELLGGHKGHGRAARWPSPVPGHPQTGRTPPMSIFLDHHGIERWTCFATGASGTAIDLLVVNHGISVRDAIEHLGHRANLHPLEPDQRLPHRPRPQPQRPATRPPLPEPSPAIEAHVATCEQLLWKPAGTPVRRWLMAERGWSEAALRANRIGADPGPRRLPRPAGLPRAGPAAILPALDARRRAVYLQARYLELPRSGRKYDNPTAALAANPRTTLVHTPARRALVDETVLICEGVPDAITAATAGIDSWAVLGAGYPDQRVAATLAADHRNLVIAFDADPAGRAGAERLGQLLTERGRTASTLPLAHGDLSDWAGHARSQFPRALQHAIALDRCGQGRGIGMVRGAAPRR